MTRLKAFTAIDIERNAQDHKWGEQNHTPALWLAILTEEVGEVAKEAQEMAFNGKSSYDYKTELVQVAAVCVAMLEAIDRTHQQ